MSAVFSFANMNKLCRKWPLSGKKIRQLPKVIAVA